MGSGGLSDDGEDHGELVGNETSTPEIVLGVEHVAVLEGGEPDAVQVETPDDHLGVVVGGGMEVREGEGEDRRWVAERAVRAAERTPRLIKGWTVLPR